ncbi:MAG TPA: hypothetical protein EYQ81_07680 [Sneathiellales bacterium]|nr:hypothetical protein [Sneathiellales bacterium]
MATKPKTQTDTKPKKAESPAPKAETAKADSTETKPSTDSDGGDGNSGDSGDSGGSNGGAKASSASSRPISYFSSVSTDDYRSGWDGIFSKGKNKTAAKPAIRPAAKRTKKLPMTITLEADDLDPEIRDQLDALLRKQAKKERLNYDKLSGNGQVSWQISCRISNG